MVEVDIVGEARKNVCSIPCIIISAHCLLFAVGDIYCTYVRRASTVLLFILRLPLVLLIETSRERKLHKVKRTFCNLRPKI